MTGLKKKEHWPDPLPILRNVVYPYLKKDSTVCEVGVGTGRFSKHIIKRITKGKIYLIDKNLWVVSFLTGYFKPSPRIKIILNDGRSLSGVPKSGVDLVFSNGMFIELGLAYLYLYSLQFYKVLKRGGYCVLNYLDISIPDGWVHLKKFAKKLGYSAYFTPNVVDKIFTSAGFEIVGRHYFNKSVYLIARKK